MNRYAQRWRERETSTCSVVQSRLSHGCSGKDGLCRQRLSPFTIVAHSLAVSASLSEPRRHSLQLAVYLFPLANASCQRATCPLAKLCSPCRFVPPASLSSPPPRSSCNCDSFSWLCLSANWSSQKALYMRHVREEHRVRYATPAAVVTSLVLQSPTYVVNVLCILCTEVLQLTIHLLYNTSLLYYCREPIDNLCPL